eukprot:PhF_6_TR19977/c0_g1_i1/m.29137
MSRASSPRSSQGEINMFNFQAGASCDSLKSLIPTPRGDAAETTSPNADLKLAVVNDPSKTDNAQQQQHNALPSNFTSDFVAMNLQAIWQSLMECLKTGSEVCSSLYVKLILIEMLPSQRDEIDEVMSTLPDYIESKQFLDTLLNTAGPHFPDPHTFLEHLKKSVIAFLVSRCGTDMEEYTEENNAIAAWRQEVIELWTKCGTDKMMSEETKKHMRRVDHQMVHDHSSFQEVVSKRFRMIQELKFQKQAMTVQVQRCMDDVGRRERNHIRMPYRKLLEDLYENKTQIKRASARHKKDIVETQERSMLMLHEEARKVQSVLKSRRRPSTALSQEHSQPEEIVNTHAGILPREVHSLENRMLLCRRTLSPHEVVKNHLGVISSEARLLSPHRTPHHVVELERKLSKRRDSKISRFVHIKTPSLSSPNQHVTSMQDTLNSIPASGLSKQITQQTPITPKTVNHSHSGTFGEGSSSTAGSFRFVLHGKVVRSLPPSVTPQCQRMKEHTAKSEKTPKIEEKHVREKYERFRVKVKQPPMMKLV